VKARTSTKEKVFAEKDARALLDGIYLLISGKGKKAVTVDLRREKPGWAELSKLMLGPTGNLRAPVIRKGKTLIIGFHVETYEEQLT
jgi:arsenate reductase-like glutaredoxin family protein